MTVSTLSGSSVHSQCILCQGDKTAQVKLDNKAPLPAKLFELPLVVESHRTFDQASYYKTGDVHQARFAV